MGEAQIMTRSVKSWSEARNHGEAQIMTRSVNSFILKIKRDASSLRHAIFMPSIPMILQQYSFQLRQEAVSVNVFELMRVGADIEDNANFFAYSEISFMKIGVVKNRGHV